MHTRPAPIVATAGVADWAAESEHRTAWLAHCIARHAASDWGDLDPDDRRANRPRRPHPQRTPAVPLGSPLLALSRKRHRALGHHRRPRRPGHRHHVALAERVLTTEAASDAPLASDAAPVGLDGRPNPASHLRRCLEGR
jgi:hypothetical protein